MSMAMKCDRCGVFFDPFHMPSETCFVRFRNPVLKKSGDLRDNLFGGTLMFSTKEPDALIDLCPECSEDFETFLCVKDIPDIVKKEEESLS